MENNDAISRSEESSDFLSSDAMAGSMDMGGLFSNRFANIKPVWVSAKGPCALYSATRYGRRFILKGLKEEFRNDPIRNLAVAKEFEIGFSLEHPNIRRTLGLEEADGLGQVIVLEYIDGRSLEEAIRNDEITPKAGREICRQLAEAVEYIHAKQTLHRDIKPANILLTHKGDAVRLIDFNLSDSDSFIILKNPAGSGKYIAPELLTGNTVHSPATDIYSLGVVAGEIAEATSDCRLAALASKCKDRDPGKRTEALHLLKECTREHPLETAMTRTFDSKWLTAILLAAAAMLTSLIAIRYLPHCRIP